MSWRKFEYGTAPFKPFKLHITLQNIRVPQMLLIAYFNKLDGVSWTRGIRRELSRSPFLFCSVQLSDDTIRHIVRWRQTHLSASSLSLARSLSLSLSLSLTHTHTHTHTHQQMYTIYIKSRTIHTPELSLLHDSGLNPQRQRDNTKGKQFSYIQFTYKMLKLINQTINTVLYVNFTY